MKMLKSYVLATTFALAMLLGSSGASATFDETLVDLAKASTPKATSSLYNALALSSPREPSFKYYTYVYANQAYLALYWAWVHAPAGSYTQLYAQYAFQNELQARNYALAANYGYDYGTTVAYYQWLAALYVGVTNLSAVYGM